jgi:hypothetical protein
MSEKFRNHLSNRHLTVRELADEVGTAKTMCQEILTEKFCMQHFSATFLPSLLTDEQKQKCLEVKTFLTMPTMTES